MTQRSLLHRFRSILSPRAATLAGALLGLLMGWYGIVFGGILGAIVDALRSQRGADRQLVEWLENPGGGCRIDEPLPGLVAFCSLGVLLLLENVSHRGHRSASAAEESGIVWKMGLLSSTLAVSLQEQRALLENIARVAYVYRELLNPDLLAEVLAARRRQRGDIAVWLALLAALCDSTASRTLFKRIVRDIDPSSGFAGGAEGSFLQGNETVSDTEAWTIMGLGPGSSKGELSRVYRRLARQFHPDALHGLDEEHLRQAANAFLRIDGAYRSLTKSRPA